MTNGKNKGSEFERNMCRYLTGQLEPGSAKPIFWRAAGVGGNQEMTGDICVLDHNSAAGIKFIEQFAVECKFYKDLQRELWKHIGGKSKVIAGFVSQAKRQAGNSKHYLLIMKTNGLEPLVLCDHPKYASLSQYGELCFLDTFMQRYKQLNPVAY